MADNSHDKDSHQESRRRDIGSGQAKIGVWRSWLAYASGGRVVASSSLVTPTMHLMPCMTQNDRHGAFLRKRERKDIDD